MNIDTGELVAFENEEEAAKFFKEEGKIGDFVLVDEKHMTPEEISNKVVENTEIRECLAAIDANRNAPRGVRRRLEKRLTKLRKKNEQD